MNFTVGLTNSTGLNGNLVATSLYSFNFLVLVESPFTWFSLQLEKWTFFPLKADTFCEQQPHHRHW